MDKYELSKDDFEIIDDALIGFILRKSNIGESAVQVEHARTLRDRFIKAYTGWLETEQ